MGACCSSEKVEPVEAARDDFDGPVKGRSCTDVIGLVLLLGFATVLFGLVGYCIFNGDIYRLIYGYDNCGNVCGRITPKESDGQFPCKGADFRDKKFLLIKKLNTVVYSEKKVEKECVKNCSEYPNYVQFLHRCIPLNTNSTTKRADIINTSGLKDFFHEVSEDLHNTAWEMFLLCLIAFALSVVMLFLLKLFAGFMVWVILIGTLGLSVIGTIYCWILWSQKKNEQSYSESDNKKTTTYLAVAIVATVITVIIFLVIIVLRKRIKLVVELFHEAGKAITKMPLLLIQPIFTVFTLVLVIALWMYFSILIQSAGKLALAEPNYYYKKDFAMKFTRWYNLFGLFWMIQFCIGCQHMIIAGAVATWFFTRDKDSLSSPIQKSICNLAKYHLGSVAVGSLILALFQLIRTILKSIEQYAKDSGNSILEYVADCCQCIVACFENCVKYITRNAYIEIAVYGQSFCTSGQQAFKVLVNNALRVTAINTVGDFVLALAKVGVVIVTVFIGTKIIGEKEGVHQIWLPITLAGLFAYFIAHCFFTVYEMVIDTIFICFCEDCEINDGINKPYFMSRNLMEFVKNSKKVLKVGDSPVQTPLKEM